MDDLALSKLFEGYHKYTIQYRKYRLSHNKKVTYTGQVHYLDNRTNWSWLTFKRWYIMNETNTGE